MKTGFNIYDYVQNNKFSLKVEQKGTRVSKGYNDIRKTNINNVIVKDGKFSLQESLDANRPLGTEVKKHFLEIISTYKSFSEQMRRPSDIVETAETLGGVVDAARTLTLSEAGDWFDKVTIKRNMNELEKLDKSFDKVASEARALDERLHALYEDMGNILGRYYEIADLDPNVMKERLGNTTIKEAKKYDIGSGYMGNGLTVWNRAEEEFGDYKTIAHIGNNGELKIYDKGMPGDIKKMLQIWATSMKKGNKGPQY
jgi:hypothetical protein